MQKVRPGIYKHYKDNLYLVMGEAIHSDSQEIMVVYRGLYDEYQLYTRPKEVFTGTVEVDGKLMPRFVFVSPLPELA